MAKTTKTTTAKAAKKPSTSAASKKKATTSAKKVSAEKTASTASAKTTSVAELQGLDRRGLAARARQLKTELLAIRFNLQSPSLKDYRKKKKELATVMSQLS